MKKFLLAAAVTLAAIIPARADYYVRDGQGNLKLFKAGTLAGGVVLPYNSLTDSFGLPFGTLTNPVATKFGTGVTLPDFANPQHFICDSGCNGGGGGSSYTVTYGQPIGTLGTPTGFKDASGNFQSLLGDTTNGQWVNVKASVAIPVTGTFWPYTLGQQVNASSVPVVLTAAQFSALTPLSSVGISGTLPAFAATPTFNIGTAPTITVSGSVSLTGTLPAFAATPTFNLGTLNGAATAANQTGGSQKTQIVDSLGNVIAATSNALNVAIVSGGGSGGTASAFGSTFPAQGTAAGMSQGGNMVALTGTGGNLNVQCANCSGSGASATDGAAFTAGTSVFAPAGGVFNDGLAAVTSGNQATARITTNRAVHMNLRTAAGVETGVAAAPLQVSLANTAANATAVKVDGSAVTQPVSGTVTANAGTNLNTSLLALESGGNLAQIVTDLGAPGATACTTDTASCNQNQQLQRIAQRLTSTITALGSPFQAGGSIGNTSFAATQATASSLNATVVGTGTFAVQAAPSSAAAWGVNSLGSTTSGQLGVLALGAVTTAAPTYTTAQSNALSLTTAGDLRTVFSNSSIAVTQASAASLNATVVGTGTFAVQAAQSGNWPVRMQDGAGTALTSATRGAQQALSIQVVDASGNQVTSFGGANASVSATASAVPASATYIGMAQGGNLTGLTGTSGNLNVQCANCSGSGVSTADAATFTAGASLFAGGGGFFQTTATSNPLTNGQQGMFQVTANRALFTNLRNASGTEVGVSGAELFVGGRGTAGSAAGGVLTVQGVASMTPLLTTTTLNAETTKVIGTVNISAAQTIAVTNAGTFATQPASATAPVSTMNSASANSGLNVANAAVFDDVTPTSITENSFGFLRMSANRNLYGTIRDAAGNERGTNVDASNRLTTAPTLVSGSVASGAFASGSVASGAFASGSIASGAIAAGAQVDLLTMRGTKNGGTAATNSILAGLVYNATPLTLTDGQGASLQGDANGYLKVTVASAVGLGAGSTTSGQTGSIVMCAVTTSAPTYTTGQTNFLSCDTSGNLRTSGGGGGGGAVTMASGAVASGAYSSGAFASGAVASGAYASGSLASGAVVDLTNLSTPITPATATATKGVLLGMQYNSTQATFTNGQQGSVQGSSRGALYVAVGADGFNVTNAGTFAVQIAANSSVNVAQINGVTPLMGNGGTGTGSQRVTIASDNTAFSVNPVSATVPVSTMNSASANNGLNSAMSAVFDDTSPTAITENNFGFVRMSANRNQYTTLRDAAGNERGVNVTAGNALTVDGSAVTQPVRSVAATTGGASFTGNIAANNTTAVVVKGSAGTLYGVQVYGIGSAPAYLKIYNATTATCGSGTPVKRLMIPAAATAANGAGSNITFGPQGLNMSTGITYCVTTGIGDADTTAPAASTFLINIDWL